MKHLIWMMLMPMKSNEIESSRVDVYGWKVGSVSKLVGLLVHVFEFFGCRKVWQGIARNHKESQAMRERDVYVCLVWNVLKMKCWCWTNDELEFKKRWWLIKDQKRRFMKNVLKKNCRVEWMVFFRIDWIQSVISLCIRSTELLMQSSIRNSRKPSTGTKWSSPKRWVVCRKNI